MLILSRRSVLSGIALTAGAAAAPSFAQSVVPGAVTDARDGPLERIDPYQPRFGRAKPVIAVLAFNAGSELADYATPFGVLSQSGAAEVISVATSPGIAAMRPLKIQPNRTIAEFDARYAQGADYVIVPAVADPRDAILLAWIAAQAAKGATIVSICNGSLVVAATGLMDGKRATGHWGSERRRAETFPAVKWQKNIRYVADGRIVSSSGISAAIPTSLALVEAIAGRQKAAALAEHIGVADWSSRHNSDAFQLPPGQSSGHRDAAPTDVTVGIPVADGVDEIAFCLTADAFAHTRKATVFAVAESLTPITTRGGLIIVPERVFESTPAMTTMLGPLPAGPSARALDHALRQIAESYGEDVAARVARTMEYPGYKS